MKRIIITSLYALFCFIIGTILCSHSLHSQSYLIPKNNYFEAYVVVPNRATEIERYAADELAKYITKITGARIYIIKEIPELPYFSFYIGQTTKGKSYVPAQKSPYNGANGFRIKSIPNGLVISGGDDLSTLFGVYAFLEEYQGCGWFMPYELSEVVPRGDRIYIPQNIDVTQIPDIPIRWIGTDDWALKNRMNTGIQLHGHNVGVINKWIFHTYVYLVPDDQYFEVHPEYFSLVEKKRVRGGRAERGQICTTNPEVIKLVSQHLIDNLVHDPDINFISLTANDWPGFCTCSRCNKYLEPERKNELFGSATGRVHPFNNEVARRVKKYCPDQLIKVGAYWLYYRYPLDPSYKPADNLSEQITSNIEFCHNHAINDPSCPYNADFMQDFRKWIANVKHLQIYGYNSLHGWAQLPWPMVHALRKDMPQYHRIGTELFFTQYWYLSLSYALNYHVAAKLAWNSSLNVDSLITAYCKKMYGSAAPAMERYHRFLEDSWEKNPHHVGYFVEPVTLSMPKFFPPEVMIEAECLLHEAELVDTDALSKKRVNLIRIDFDYLRLVLNYLESISRPFKGIDPKQNSIGWENAINEAASIGEILSNNVLQYLKLNYPDSIKQHWGTAVERMLQAHKQPERIPGAQRGN